MTLTLRPPFLLLLSLFLFCAQAQAQTSRQEALTEIDKTFMANQRASINDLCREHYGRQLTGQRLNDFALLQRLLDDQLVKPTDVLTLQAMGVIFGDIIAKELRLSWTIYIDQYGRSRALAIPKQRDVIFPVTMISRRIQAGANVNIDAVYQKARDATETIKRQIVVY